MSIELPTVFILSQPPNIHERSVAVYGENFPSNATVKRWALEFQCGSESSQYDTHSRLRPTSTLIQLVHYTVRYNTVLADIIEAFNPTSP